MPNDITTLAIEIQSQEAERNLRTFNKLLSLGSQTAQKMEKISIDMDASSAFAQLQALRNGYANLAASLNDLHLDVAMPEMPAVSAPGGPAVDTSALEELKAFFASTAEMTKALREEMTQFNESLRELEANSTKTATAGGARTSSMSHGITVSREYAAALKELAAAQKEMEKTAAQAEAASGPAIAADKEAEAIKKRLKQTQRELVSVSKQLAETHRTWSGDIIGLSEKEELLKNKVLELKEAYKKATAEADRQNQKMEESSIKAENAKIKYEELKAKLDAMPKHPMGNASESTQTFAQKAKLAGTQLTKLARGFNSVAMLAGGAIPGVAGLGRAISMFGMVNPYVAAAALAIGACVAVYKEYDKVMQDTAVAAGEMAAEQAKLANSFKKEAQERQTDLDRLAVLNSYENLYDAEKEESRRIVEKLTSAYKGLEIQYDAVTGKVLNLAEVTRQMREQDRKSLLEKQRATVEMARQAATTQLAESQRNSVGWFRNFNTGFFGFGADSAQTVADNLYAYINSAKDLEEQIKRVNEVVLHLDKIRGKGGDTAWAMDAKNFAEQLKKSREQLLEYQKQWKILQEIQNASGVGSGRSQKAISESLRAREAKLQEARNASKSKSERYEENIAAIERLLIKQRELSRFTPMSIVAYDGKNITAKEALLDIETKITKRTRERLAYERQLAALNDKIETQERLLKKDKDGNIIGKKDSAGRDTERQRNIRYYEAVSQRSPDEITRTQGKYKLMQLQIEQLNADEQNNRARKQWEKGRSRFVYDKKGNIVREKTDAELAGDRKKEIAAAEAKAAKYTRGSTEWYGAMAEVDRLRQEDFKKRQETSFANLGFSQMQAHNNMTQGVEARSSQALRLETRNFSKPDNAWKTLEKKQSQIHDTISGFGPDIAAIAEANRSISDKLVQV